MSLRSKTTIKDEAVKLRKQQKLWQSYWKMGNKVARAQFSSYELLNKAFEDKLQQLDEELTAVTGTEITDISAEVVSSSEFVIPKRKPWPGNTATLRKFQQDAVDWFWWMFFAPENPLKVKAALLDSATGTGKTFIICQLIADLWAEGIFEGKTFSPSPVMVITAASVVPQFRRVAENVFGLKQEHLMVINYEMLRSDWGQLYVQDETVIRQGEPHIEWKWKPGMNPAFLVFDESHKLKNEDSTQSRIGQAVNKLPEQLMPVQLFSSATPWCRIADTKCFTIACGCEMF